MKRHPIPVNQLDLSARHHPGWCMPRLTNQHYLDLQHWLTDVWREHQWVFSLISPREQWHIHDYFVPDWSFTEEELLLHRSKMRAERPSLPAVAGRAVSRMNLCLLTAQTQASNSSMRPASGS